MQAMSEAKVSALQAVPALSPQSAAAPVVTQDLVQKKVAAAKTPADFAALLAANPTQIDAYVDAAQKQHGNSFVTKALALAAQVSHPPAAIAAEVAAAGPQAASSAKPQTETIEREPNDAAKTSALTDKPSVDSQPKQDGGAFREYARVLSASPADAREQHAAPDASSTHLEISTAVLGEAGRAVGQALEAEVARGSDAVVLSHTVHEVATRELARLAPMASPQQRADASMALATYALVGRDNINKLRAVDDGTTGLVGYMQATERQDQAAPRSDIARWPNDKTNAGGTLDPRFSDGTGGQAFHIGFFIAAGYVSDESIAKTAKVMGAAVYHETLDRSVFERGGNSRADYIASAFGALAGAHLKAMRDRGDGDLIGSVISGFMAKEGATVPRPEGRSDARHAIALAEIKALIDARNTWAAKLAVDFNIPINGLLGGVNVAKWVIGTKEVP